MKRFYMVFLVGFWGCTSLVSDPIEVKSDVGFVDILDPLYPDLPNDLDVSDWALQDSLIHPVDITREIEVSDIALWDISSLDQEIPDRELILDDSFNPKDLSGEDLANGDVAQAEDEDLVTPEDSEADLDHIPDIAPAELSLCLPGETRPCYSGLPGTQNLGECREGKSLCDGQTWGPCEDEVIPTEEVCDNLDNDCDGKVDFPGMICIPGGAFMMGADDGSEAETPIHEVFLSAYGIDDLPITNGEYDVCVGEGECLAPQNFDPEGHPNYPVTNVTWAMATQYCAWAGKRLPTEAEWERACRGPEGSTYPWGEDEPTCELANFRDCAMGLMEVGSWEADATPEGVRDMAGNIWEWTRDYYDPGYYSISPTENPTGPESGETRSIRCGAHDTGAPDMRCSARRGTASPSGHKGFRCAM